MLNVGTAHLGEFGSVDAIALAKGELVEALPSAEQVASRCSTRTTRACARWRHERRPGRASSAWLRDADVRAEDVRLLARARASFMLATPEGSAPVELRLVGAHQVANALAAAAVARGARDGRDRCGRSAFPGAPVSRWRMEVVERAGRRHVVNDAYNANPESVRAALEALVGLGRGTAVPGRCWARCSSSGEAARRAARVGRASSWRASASTDSSWSAMARAPIADAARTRPLLGRGRPSSCPTSTLRSSCCEREVCARGDVVLVKASRCGRPGARSSTRSLLDDGVRS